jgi:hypothetical protein
VPTSPNKAKEGLSGGNSRRYLNKNQAPQIMVNEDIDPLMSGLKKLKRTRNINQVSETINTSPRGNSIDMSMGIPHNSSVVSLRGHLRRQVDIGENPNQNETFHSL